MSVGAQAGWWLRCCRCSHEITVDAPTLTDALDQAQAWGWWVDRPAAATADAQHVCPLCVDAQARYEAEEPGWDEDDEDDEP